MNEIITTKCCTGCRSSKPANTDNFKPGPNGALRAKCIPCLTEYERRRKWEKNHPGVSPPPRDDTPIGMKRCITCLEYKPRDRQHFQWRNGPDCPASQCKLCESDRKRGYHRNNRDLTRIRRRSRPVSAKVRVIRSIRARVNAGLCGRERAGSMFALLGYTRVQLRQHLERTFKPGMTWENYGTAWVIDHILPVVLFDLSDDEMVSQCWALTNLRALSRTENSTKAGRRLHLL